MPEQPPKPPVVPTNKTTDKEVHEEVDNVASELTFKDALKKYVNAKKYVDNSLRKRWDWYFRIYKGERVNPSYIGSISVANREPHTIIETLVSSIAGGLPEFHFIPTNENQSKDTKVLNGILDYYMGYNDMNIKNQIWVRDMLLYGTGILHVAWRDSKVMIENIALRDFFVDPTSTDFTKTQSPARYAGYEYLITMDELKNTMIYSADQDKMVPKYKNLDKIGNVPQYNGDVSTMDKKFKDLFFGSTLDNAAYDQVHVVLMYDLDSGKIVEIGNQKEFIYYADSHLQRDEQTRPSQAITEGAPEQEMLDEIEPFLPFAALRDYIDSSLFYGEGEMAVIMGDAELLSDYESMDADNNAYQNTPMYQIDPQFADMASEIETIPGAVYPIPKGALTPIERPQLGQDLEMKKNAIAERMRRETAADEAVQGVSQQQGRITATEVSTQLQQSQGRFSTKITNLGYGGYAQLGSIIFKMVQIFATQDTVIRLVGKDGVEFKNFDPWEFNGEYEAQVKLDSDIKRKQMEVGQKNAQIFQILEQAPIFDPIEKYRFIIQQIDPNFSDEEFNEMLNKQPAQPGADTKDYAQLDKLYALVPPATQQAILKMLGLPEDPELDAQVQTNMMTHAGTQADIMHPHTDTQGNPIVGPPEAPIPEPPAPTPLPAQGNLTVHLHPQPEPKPKKSSN